MVYSQAVKRKNIWGPISRFLSVGNPLSTIDMELVVGCLTLITFAICQRRYGFPTIRKMKVLER